MAQAREIDYPRWATAGGADVVEPNEGRKDLGFEEDDVADEGEFNWLHRTSYRWARWLDESHLGRELRGSSSWMTTGFGFATSVTLTSPCGAGVVVRAGTRLELDAPYLAATSQDSHVFTASRDTYVFIDDERVLQFVVVGNGAGAPATPANTTRVQVVVTNGTSITSVTNSLNLGPILAPAEGVRVAPRLILGLGDATPPIAYFDVGTAAPTANLEHVGNAFPPVSAFYVRQWVRASSRINEVLTGAASVHVVGNSDTDNTAKQWSWAAAHYDVDDEPVGLVRAAIDNVDNVLQLGGGASHLNAATRVQFYTAANRTTTTGTMVLELQGNGSLVYLPVGLARLGDGTNTPVLTINRPTNGEGGLEHTEASTRRWLGPYISGITDDLQFWRWSGVTDQGVSLRLRSSDGAVVVPTAAGVSLEVADASGVFAIRSCTHVGAEGGIFDINGAELGLTKAAQTNTNGNEDFVLIPAAKMLSRGVFAIKVIILGTEDTNEANAYCREQTLVFRRIAAANVSFASITPFDSGAAGGGGGWAGTCSAGVSAVSGDLVCRVTAADTIVRNWEVLVTFVRTRALN